MAIVDPKPYLWDPYYQYHSPVEVVEYDYDSEGRVVRERRWTEPRGAGWIVTNSTRLSFVNDNPELDEEGGVQES